MKNLNLFFSLILFSFLIAQYGWGNDACSHQFPKEHLRGIVLIDSQGVSVFIMEDLPRTEMGGKSPLRFYKHEKLAFEVFTLNKVTLVGVPPQAQGSHITIAPIEIELIIDALKKFAAILDQQSIPAENRMFIATSPIREALNRDEVLFAVQSRAGLPLRILSIEEELPFYEPIGLPLPPPK